MPDIEIFTYETERFWLLMGHYFAHRSYALEMGGWQFYTKPGSIWFVALIDGQVVGFCSAIHEKTHWFFDNFYVLKEHRGKGYASALHDIRMKHVSATQREIRVISDNPKQITKYYQYGFILTGTRGRYSKYKWHPHTAAYTHSNQVFATKSLESKQGQ